jgi:thioredoxin-related protein
MIAMLIAASIAAEPAPKTQWLVFSTANCTPCRELKADLSLNLRKSEGWKVGTAESNYVRYVDEAKFPALVAQYKVTCYPTLILIRDSIEVERHEGKLSALEVARRFNREAVKK